MRQYLLLLGSVLAGGVVLLATSGCSEEADSPASSPRVSPSARSTPMPAPNYTPPTPSPWRGARVSGSGQSVKPIQLVEGVLVCEASISGNTNRGGASHVAFKIVGDTGSNLLVNDIASSGEWSKSVRVRDAGSYLVEVSAERAAEWLVFCRRP